MNLKGLTQTEQDIVFMAAIGKPHAVIAAANKVSEETVREVIERQKERDKPGSYLVNGR